MKRQRLSEEERREQILEAAFRIATRDRIESVTGRLVAKEAGLSSGLVFFHFKSKEQLLLALTDWVVGAIVSALVLPDAAAAERPAGERLLAFVADRLQRLARRREREQVELFFDLWVLGTRHAGVREKLRGALARYREVLSGLAAEVIAADPVRYAGVAPETLATAATGFIHGSAVQAVMDPAHFDVDALVVALRALLLPSVAAAAATASTSSATKPSSAGTRSRAAR